MKLVFIWLALISSSAFCLPVGQATVRLTNEGLSGIAAKDVRPDSQAMQIIEAKNCTASSTKTSRMNVSANCQFLHGVFRYFYKKNGVQQQTVLAFALSRKGTNSRAFIVSEPVHFVKAAR